MKLSEKLKISADNRQKRMKIMIVFIVIIIAVVAVAVSWMLIAGAWSGIDDHRASDEEQMKACHMMNEARKKKKGK